MMLGWVAYAIGVGAGPYHVPDGYSASEVYRRVTVRTVSAKPPPSGILESWISFTFDKDGERGEFYVRFMALDQFIPAPGSVCDVSFTRQLITGNNAIGPVNERQITMVVQGMTCDSGIYRAD